MVGEHNKTPKVQAMGVTFDNLTFLEAVERLLQMAMTPVPQFAVTPNVDHVVRLQDDADLRAAYLAADLVLCDGMPLKWGMRLLGKPLKAKISGSDLLPVICSEGACRELRPFFLGGRPGVAATCARRMTEQFPSLRVAGTHSPPFSFEDDPEADAEIIQIVRNASPDILFVALGTPRQEKYIYRRSDDLGVPLSIGVGAAIDFAAGVSRRAPVLMRRFGLEWFWRLAHEPRRLCRRYLIDDIRYFHILLTAWRSTRASR